jgi:hypothetical protein
MKEVTAMRQILVMAVGVGILACVPHACRAEWGWPPPGYSTTGVRACDGSQYRGLCAVIRDRRNGIRLGPWWKRGTAGEPAPCAAPAAPEAAQAPSPAPADPSVPGQ